MQIAIAKEYYGPLEIDHQDALNWCKACLQNRIDQDHIEDQVDWNDLIVKDEKMDEYGFIVWNVAFHLKNYFDMKVELDRKDIIRLIRGFGFPSFDMAIRYMEKGMVDCSAGMGSENFYWKLGVFDNMDEDALFGLYSEIKIRYGK